MTIADTVNDGLGGLDVLLKPEYRNDPYYVYKSWRDSGPIRMLNEKAFIVTGYEPCSALLRDSRLGHDDIDLIGVEEGYPFVRSFLRMNPPDHTRLRRLVSKAFTPGQINRLSPRIEQITAQLLSTALESSGPFDLMESIARPLPVIVICELLGVPSRNREDLAKWSDILSKSLDPLAVLTEDDRRLQIAARGEFAAFIMDQVKTRRKRPGDDLLSALVAVHDNEDTLTELELISTSILLLIAGHETTTGLISNSFLALMRHPEQLKLLQQNIELIPHAVEEFLRYDSTVQLTARMALEDVEYGGIQIPRESFVALVLGGANRDPQVNPDPDRLDLTRQSSKHLSFGHGIHACIGAPLARLESGIAIRSIVQSGARLELAEEPRWTESIVFRKPERLMLEKRTA